MEKLKYLQGGVDKTHNFGFLPPLTRDTNFSTALPIHRHVTTDGSNVEYYSFDENLSIASDWIVTSMYIPGFFFKTETDLKGMFLLRFASKDIISNFYEDKSLGKHGCGYRIYTPTDGIFKFNGLTYHPFVLRNLMVCFFSCDTNSPYDLHWRGSADIGVAVQERAYYDHKFNLLITEDAELRKI